MSNTSEQPPLPLRERLLKKEELQKHLPASATTLWRMERRGDLIPIRIGGVRYWRGSDIADLLGC